MSRWRLHRAGIQNVWHYWDVQFALPGGRMVLRGTNGSGKSRALELLLPFLLDADRRRMDSTGSGAVNLDRLMKVGGPESGNRVGYLWLELIRDVEPWDDATDPDPSDPTTDDGHPDPTPAAHYLTLGAHLRWSSATSAVKVHWFTTDRRVGHDLPLIDAERNALTREELGRLIGTEQVTDSADGHRATVRRIVFGLTDARAEERFDGLVQLLHTLRSPDVGNRIDEGRLPALLSDALPPLSQTTLDAAGAKLDEISETRALQERLERSVADLEKFLGAYRRYAAGELAAATVGARDAGRMSERGDRTEKAAARAAEQALADAARAAGEHLEAQDALTDAQATLRGLQDSADHRELLERANTVAARRQTADRAATRAAEARTGEETAAGRVRAEVADAGQAAGRTGAQLARVAEAVAGAGMPSPLPGGLDARTVDVPGATEPVRAGPERDPEPLRRPARTALDLAGVDPAQLRAGTATVRQAVTDRRELIGARLTEHRRLTREERGVEQAEAAAVSAEERATDSAGRRDAAAAAQTDSVAALAREWRSWTQAPQTLDHLGKVSWAGTAAEPWLAATTGPDPDRPPAPVATALTADALDALDRAAAETAEPAADRLADARAALDTELAALTERRRELDAERAELVAERDPAPARPGWVTGSTGTPLWRAVDFAPGTSDADQAAIEAALIGSGLLTAVLGTDGAAAPGTGELLIDAAGPVTARPLAEVLVPDPGSGVPAEQIAAVLARIGWGDRSGSSWLDADGSFAVGVLAGRHTVPYPRHIGATARARSRAERLAAIDAELAELTVQEQRHTAERARLVDELAQLRAYARTAPRSARLRAATGARAHAQEALDRDAAAAQRAARTAAERRALWSAAHQRHAEACARLGLPTDETALEQTRDRAGAALTALDALPPALDQLTHALARVSTAETAADDAAERRRAAEAAAEDDRTGWHEAATELAAAEKAAGLDAQTAQAELRAAEVALTRARTRAKDADDERLRTHGAATGAQAQAHTAAVAAESARGAAREAEAALRRRVDLPGLAEAAGAPDLPAAGPLVVALLAALPDPLPEPDPDGYQKALRELDRHRDPADYDLLTSVVDGVQLVEIAEAGGRRSLPAAVAELVRRRDSGRTALTDKEQRIFTTFVLGSVADELREQLLWSVRQIDGMNQRLAAIRTSHGIGVEIRWPLAEGADSGAARIEELVRTRASARSAEANAELTTLLQGRVDEQLRADPAQGYAAALRAALDHRAWHTVEVFILGPGEGERRRISRRARLSQGETRVVSYVALFAAADAFYAGLRDPGALRLILLDDAFAKVDERTVGELMALLVRLDLDFVMTGHALWGFGPEMPSLDVYEVRRAEGTPAITTRVHWDGTSRHVLG